ncbi:MAG: GDSL-type esterase/lipase family protein [Clostridia bacterium]|nr:GDSL-type esterase/lipase family protein [Clostridia bacterium]
MKKTFTKSLAVFLCTLMLFSCFALAGSAATKENVYQYGADGGYLAVGDSIGKGCGAEGSYIGKNGETLTVENCGGQYNDNDCRYVKGSYAAQVADAVGCEAPANMNDKSGNFWPCTFGGMTTAVALDLYGIDDGYTDTTLNYEYYKWCLDYFGYEGSLRGARDETFDPNDDGRTGSIIDVTKKASLITIELGMCDIFYRTYRVVTEGGLLGDGLDIDFTNVDTMKKIITSAVGLLNEGYDNWAKQYPLLLERIIELNPDATIVMVGSFNMVNQMTILDQTMFPLGSLFSSFTDRMNKQYEKWAKKYNVLYADISNTEALCTQEDWSLMGKFLDGNCSFPGSHPSMAGYDYITRQILGLLPDKDGNVAGSNGTNIVFDMVRFDKDSVKSVFVNGIPVKNHTFDGNTITIPCKTILATKLLVKVVSADGTEGFQTYNVTYKFGKGYEVERVFGNNDTESWLGRPIELFKMLIDLIKGLFK